MVVQTWRRVGLGRCRAALAEDRSGTWLCNLGGRRVGLGRCRATLAEGGSIWDVVVQPWRRVGLGRGRAALAEGRSRTLSRHLGGGRVDLGRGRATCCQNVLVGESVCFTVKTEVSPKRVGWRITLFHCEN